MIKNKGFALLEVMVALFILAVAAAALSRTAGQATDTAQQLEVRQHAGWVAHNQLSLLLLGTQEALDGEINFAGQRFYWKATRATTELANFQRVTVKVSQPAQPDYILATLTGFRHDE
jgi:general secretion pathway protein I